MQLQKIARLSVQRTGPEAFLWLSMLILASAIAFTQTAVATISYTDDDVARMQRGEILLETIHSEKSGGAARVSAVFHTDVEPIWDIIGYCKYAFVYVRGLETCGVLVPGLTITRKHQRVKSHWYVPTIDFTFEGIRTSPTHGEFRLVEGDLKIMEGQWNFQPLEDRGSVIVTHEIRIRPKIPAPRWLMRRVLKKDLPDMLACMRGLAQASGDDVSSVEDLGRCPGDPSQLGE
jgi:hypothetical protein